jgi:hypothetical protein
MQDRQKDFKKATDRCAATIAVQRFCIAFIVTRRA